MKLPPKPRAFLLLVCLFGWGQGQMLLSCLSRLFPAMTDLVTDNWLVGEATFKLKSGRLKVLECAGLCVRNKLCLSFMINSKTGACRMHKVTVRTLIEDGSLGGSVGFSGYETCKVPGEWTEWSVWTTCTETCGGGLRRRFRLCLDTGSLVGPCEGASSQEWPCHTHSCLPLARTCSEWKQRGLTVDAWTNISPNGLGNTAPNFGRVFCDLTLEGGIGVTVIGHNLENRTFVNGYDYPNAYDVTLTYIIPFDLVTSVVDQSAACRQHIKWECHNSIFQIGSHRTGWKDRHGATVNYFGGAGPGYTGCACGLTDTCSNPSTSCNCDSNDDAWRDDQGWLSHKADLPVYGFTAVDTGDSYEKGYHTIGELFCWGEAT